MTTHNTYRVAAPLDTHHQRATCREVDCPHYLFGWTTTVANNSDQAAYIRRSSQRRFKEEPGDGGIVTFTFEAGQTCFRAGDHYKSLDRPAWFIKASAAGGRQGLEPERWVDEFDSNLRSIYKERNG
mgnify:CR=1 FL=1